MVLAEVLRGWLVAREERKKEQDREKILYAHLHTHFMHLSDDDCVELCLAHPDSVWYAFLSPGE